MQDNQLNSYRQSIDRIDAALIALLAERFSVTQKVGEHKAAQGLPAVDESREARQFAKIESLAAEYGLDPQVGAKFLRLVIDEVVTNHKELADQAGRRAA